MPAMTRAERASRLWPAGGDGAYCTVCGKRTVAALAADGYSDHPTCDPEFSELLERARRLQEATA